MNPWKDEPRPTSQRCTCARCLIAETIRAQQGPAPRSPRDRRPPPVQHPLGEGIAIDGIDLGEGPVVMWLHYEGGFTVLKEAPRA